MTPAAAATNTLNACQLDALLAIVGRGVTTEEIGVAGATMVALEHRGLVSADREGRPAFFCLTPLGQSAVAYLTNDPTPLDHEQPVERIKRAVAKEFKIPLMEMVSQRRARNVARPRQVAMYLAKQLTPLSLPNIGRLFGHRDHTTVMHACWVIEGLLTTDKDMRARVTKLRKAVAQ